jgi:hypothetical protein
MAQNLRQLPCRELARSTRTTGEFGQSNFTFRRLHFGSLNQARPYASPKKLIGLTLGVSKSVTKSVRPTFLLAQCLKLLQDLVLIRELASLEFGIDEFTVDLNLEAATLAWNQFQVLHFLLELRQDFGRQTDGLWFVISNCTVFELHMHNGNLQ